MSNPIFLIGAGFNIDANSYTPNQDYLYPLTNDLLKSCFDINELPSGKSIEELFQYSLKNKEKIPFQRLCDLVMGADYYIGGHFTNPDRNMDNPYYLFLENFPDSHFLTFNYDSLLEILLLNMKRWKPDDGYGIDVLTEQESLVKPFELPDHSKNLVLHLHGSFCVYPIQFYLEKNGTSPIEWIRHPEKPAYVFDPDSITHRFFPYRRIHPGPSYSFPYERVIAPIPDKAEDLKRDFVSSVYNRAASLIEQYDSIIAIGYGFGEHDIFSYNPLLKSMSNESKRLFVISPSANEIVSRIRKNFLNEIIPLELTFNGWASNEFRLS